MFKGCGEIKLILHRGHQHQGSHRLGSSTSGVRNYEKPIDINHHWWPCWNKIVLIASVSHLEGSGKSLFSNRSHSHPGRRETNHWSVAFILAWVGNQSQSIVCICNQCNTISKKINALVLFLALCREFSFVLFLLSKASILSHFLLVVWLNKLPLFGTHAPTAY